MGEHVLSGVPGAYEGFLTKYSTNSPPCLLGMVLGDSGQSLRRTVEHARYEVESIAITVSTESRSGAESSLFDCFRSNPQSQITDTCKIGQVQILHMSAFTHGKSTRRRQSRPVLVDAFTELHVSGTSRCSTSVLRFVRISGLVVFICISQELRQIFSPPGWQCSNSLVNKITLFPKLCGKLKPGRSMRGTRGQCRAIDEVAQSAGIGFARLEL